MNHAGGGFRHANLLVPSKNQKAEFGFIIMEPEHTPPMSGSNTICVSTVLLDSGMIQMQEPETEFFLEAPAGLVHVKAHCKNGKALSIKIQNVPSFADKMDQKLEVPGIGTVTVDTAYGGDSFVLLDAKSPLGSQLFLMRHENLLKQEQRLQPQRMNKLVFSTQYKRTGIKYHSASSQIRLSL